MLEAIKISMAALLLFSEMFHVLAHLNVMFRVSPPTLNQLKNKGYYFIFDGSSFFFSYLLHRRYFPLVMVEVIAHMWYVYQWNKNYYAIRIRNWSVKEYKGPWITIDWFLTWSDIITHLLMAYQLTLYITSKVY